MQLGHVGGFRILEPGAAALLPVLDHVEVHLARPAHPAFHEAEIETRMAAHHSAQENAAREGMIRLGEVSDMVVGEVADRGAILPARAAGMLCHGDAQLFAALPEKLVVVRAVQSDVVAVPRRLPRVDALRRGGNHTLLVAAEHDHPVAQLSDRVVELGDRLIRGARGDDRHGRQAAAMGREQVGRHPVVRACSVAMQLVLRNAVDREAEARVDDGEIDAQLGQPFVQQRGQKRRGLVARVGRNAPPDRAAQPFVLALPPVAAIPLVVPTPQRAHLVDRAGTAHVAQIVEEDRDRLEPMAVAIDHGMPELSPD